MANVLSQTHIFLLLLNDEKVNPICSFLIKMNGFGVRVREMGEIGATKMII